ncbi:MAG TPA: YafY family protein [Aggregatilineales bacterium]|nr:YafY family protein [Aggregatilineales bacterium]
MNRTDRLLAIVLELQAKGWQRAEDLAATFEISKRTIYRDMLALMESGVPVMSSPGQGYGLMEGYFLPPVSFSAEEAIILLLGADYMAQTFDVGYQRASRSATSKIEAILNTRSRTEVETLRRGMQFIALRPESDELRSPLLPALRSAIVQRKQVQLTYHTRHTDDPAGETNIRQVDPYALVHHGQAWYLTGYDHLRGERRIFRLDRIDALQVLEQFFTPPDHPLTMERDDALHLVIRALFTPTVARWVLEDRSFFAVGHEETPDGLLMTFHVRREEDLLAWLLGWGGQVKVLEPPSLQHRMIEAARAIICQYDSA